MEEALRSALSHGQPGAQAVRSKTDRLQLEWGCPLHPPQSGPTAHSAQCPAQTPSPPTPARRSPHAPAVPRLSQGAPSPPPAPAPWGPNPATLAPSADPQRLRREARTRPAHPRGRSARPSVSQLPRAGRARRGRPRPGSRVAPGPVPTRLVRQRPSEAGRGAPGGQGEGRAGRPGARGAGRGRVSQ